jgi:DNA end-binding protein Ku
MAAIWKGAIAFGLVNIPVQLRPAVRADKLSFRMLHAEDLSPIKYDRTCQADGAPVPWGEIVKGYEYAKGQYVVMTDEDFKAAALETSRTIDILDFVHDKEIDPRFFETPYYLVPAKGGRPREERKPMLSSVMPSETPAQWASVESRSVKHSTWRAYGCPAMLSCWS